MEQAEVKYAPGMRIIVRGEEWMVKKVETNSLGNQTLYVIGLSQLVKDYESNRMMNIMAKIGLTSAEHWEKFKNRSVYYWGEYT